MAELDKLFHVAGLDKIDVEIDMLDFQYIESCDDWLKLAKIVEILKSGQEGHYPELTHMAEAKLLQIMPLHEKKRYLALTRSATEIEAQEAQQDLAKWLTQSKDLSTIASASSHLDFKNLDHFLSKAQLNRIKECCDALKVYSLTSLQRESKADRERRKGNECFKAGEYDNATKYYTNSIALHACIDATWTNRAIAYIKLELFDYAEMDCNVAVSLNPSSIKGLTRRGLARLSQGKYKQAAFDFNSALNMQPDSKELQKLLAQALEKYKDTEGADLNLDVSSQQQTPPATATTIAEFEVPVKFTEVMDHSDLELPAGKFFLVAKHSFDSTKTEPEGDFIRISINEDDESEAESSANEEDHGNGEYVRINIMEESDDEEENDDDKIIVNKNKTSSVVPIPTAIYDEQQEIINKKQRALQLKEIGNQLMAKNEYAQAIEAYNSSISTYYAIETINNRALAYLNLKNFDQAINDCNVVLDEDPNNIKALFRRGKSNFEKGLFSPAELDLTKAYNLDQSNKSVANLLDSVRLKLEEIKTQEDLKAQLKKQSETLKNDGNAAMNKGDFAHALEKYTESIKTDPSNLAARSNRVLAFLKLKRFLDAINDATIVVDSSDPSETIKRKAIFRRSEAFYNRAIEITLNHVEAGKLLTLAEKDLSRLHQVEPSEAVFDLLNLVKSSLETIRVSKSVDKSQSSDKANDNVANPIESSPKSSKNNVPLSPSPTKQLKNISQKPSVPEEPPKTLYEFERCWKGLQAHSDLKLQYISSFKKSTFKKIFKDTISAELLESMIEVLSLDSCSASVSKKALEGIANVSSLKLLLSLLSTPAQKGLQDVLHKLQAHYSNKSEEDKQAVNIIVTSFSS